MEPTAPEDGVPPASEAQAMVPPMRNPPVVPLILYETPEPTHSIPGNLWRTGGCNPPRHNPYCPNQNVTYPADQDFISIGQPPLLPGCMPDEYYACRLWSATNEDRAYPATEKLRKAVDAAVKYPLPTPMPRSISYTSKESKTKWSNWFTIYSRNCLVKYTMTTEVMTKFCPRTNTLLSTNVMKMGDFLGAGAPQSIPGVLRDVAQPWKPIDMGVDLICGALVQISTTGKTEPFIKYEVIFNKTADLMLKRAVIMDALRSFVGACVILDAKVGFGSNDRLTHSFGDFLTRIMTEIYATFPEPTCSLLVVGAVISYGRLYSAELNQIMLVAVFRLVWASMRPEHRIKVLAIMAKLMSNFEEVEGKYQMFLAVHYTT